MRSTCADTHTHTQTQRHMLHTRYISIMQSSTQAHSPTHSSMHVLTHIGIHILYFIIPTPTPTYWTHSHTRPHKHTPSLHTQRHTHAHTHTHTHTCTHTCLLVGASYSSGFIKRVAVMKPKHMLVTWTLKQSILTSSTPQIIQPHVKRSSKTKLRLMVHLFCSFESQLPTYDISIQDVPHVITYPSPRPRYQYFNVTLRIIWTINQSDTTIAACKQKTHSTTKSLIPHVMRHIQLSLKMYV